jgi:hypothetical protein
MIKVGRSPAKSPRLVPWPVALIGVSRQGIDSLARALRMDPSERAHLFGIS